MRKPKGPGGGNADAARSHGRVLVVDDSRLVRKVVVRQLRQAGFEADDVDGGGAALERIAAVPYDVVITDLRMPGLDGFEVLAGDKRVAPAVEVIILTGTHAKDVGCAIRALRLGAHDYLTKPPTHGDDVTLTVARAVEKKRLNEANQRLMSQLEMLSRTDDLTGLPNRRAFDEALNREISRSRRHNQPVGVVILDIDHFKRVNDTCGHPFGDQVLRAFAGIAAGGLRQEDSLYRYGGEEFAAVLSQADLAKALLAAKRIVARVAANSLSIGDATVPVTVSAGVAALRSQDDAESLMARADEALYRAKAEGRNRACAASSQLQLVSSQRSK